MEEIEIELECLQARESEKRLCISGLFEHGRNADKLDFEIIGNLSKDLEVIRIKIDFALELLESIESNAD